MVNPLKIALKFVQKLYLKSLHSIAFFPVLISFLFFVLAVGALYVEDVQWVNTIKDKLPYFFVEDNETARTILSTLIGGILSLTVFSFTMVMVLLNQASANFSPRLLPGLISDKKHQVILGIYIGTLLYCILILLSLGAYGVASNSMGLSTTLAAIFGVFCVALFVYFIHSISETVQIQNIIKRIYVTTNKALTKITEDGNSTTMGLKTVDTEDWNEILTNKSGYFQAFHPTLLADNLKNTLDQIEIIPYPGQHIWRGSPILRSKTRLNDDEVDQLQFAVGMSPSRQVADNPVGGMVQLMEIAVKALSPGINDPGTAIEAISSLGPLLCKSLNLPELTSTLLKNGKFIVVGHNISAMELMRTVVQPIRSYARKDIAVLYELAMALKFVKSQAPKSSTDAVAAELQALKEDLEISIANKGDKKRILDLLEQ